MRLFLGLLVLACAATQAAGNPPHVAEPPADASITTTLPPTEPAISVEEVTVEAPEPRYVAPTRRDRIGRVWAPVMINGRGPFRLVLDTGANGSAVVKSVAQRLGISTLNTKTVQLHGVTGSATVPTIEVDRIEVGDLMLEGKRLPVVSDVFGGAEGVLGTEGLADKRIHIDFGHDAISIMRSKRQRTEPGFASIPLTFGRDRLLHMQIMIGRVPVTAILDTGAQITVGNHALRDLLKRRRSQDLLSQDIIGVTLDVAKGEVMPIPTMHIGTIQVSNLNLTFGDMFIFQHWKLVREPALLIGMDIIGSFDVMIIDYRKKELQIRARRG